MCACEALVGCDSSLLFRYVHCICHIVHQELKKDSFWVGETGEETTFMHEQAMRVLWETALDISSEQKVQPRPSRMGISGEDFLTYSQFRFVLGV